MEKKVGEIFGGEDLVRAERHRLAGIFGLQPFEADAGGEPALFIIFAVIGQEQLGHDAEDMAAMNDDAAIIDAAVAAYRRADGKRRLGDRPTRNWLKFVHM